MERETSFTSGIPGDDVGLMLRAREGDVDAFSVLVTRYRERVEVFLFRLFWDREKAEDGAQEVFVRLWLARQRYEARGRFTTFLFQVAHNYWRDEVRRAGVRPREVELAAEQPQCKLPRAPAAAEPHHQLFVRYQQWRIQQAIARLPETLRAVFVLVHLEGHRLAEAAEVLGVPLGTVKSRMHTAIRLLRGWLASEDEEKA